MSAPAGGGQASFTVVLNSAPAANVLVPVKSLDEGEGTVSPGELVFTALNWKAPQEVVVTGVDDAVADGDQPYTVQDSSTLTYLTNEYSEIPETNYAKSGNGYARIKLLGH